MYIQSEQVSTKTNSSQVNQEKLRAYTAASSVSTGKTYAIDASTTQLTAYKEETAKSVAQKIEDEPKMTKNQMVVLSHSMSTEDYHKLQEEGYRAGTIEADQLVTTMDKIKATLAEAGIIIKGYTDQISADALREITGSEARAMEIVKSLQGADLPASEYNVEQVEEAMKMAATLTTLTDATMAYLVDNGMEPTIDSLYTAQHSGKAYDTDQRSGYFQEQAAGYIGKKADHMNWDSIKQQVEQVVQNSNLEVTEESMEEAKWLLEKSIPLTTDNLERYHDLATLTLPKDEALVMEDIVNALVNQKKAKEANLVGEENQYEKAVTNKTELLSKLEEVASSRQLEEARLVLTTQVSLACVKQGFTVDIEDIEQTIAQLKEIEKNLYQGYVSDQNQVTDTEIQQYRDTRNVVEQLPMMPLSVVGTIANHVDEVTLSQVQKDGIQARDTYERANEKYEQVMTLPSREYGDSIQKAFQNVGDILEDLELEDNIINQKAVRILGYNQMAITKDNIIAVKEADITLQRVLEQMTPKATMELIHQGINPLETSLEQLEVAVTKVATESDQADHYAKYLVQLEQRNEITPEEKEAYIGIYRLMRQVEKSDGAAVGTLVNQGEEVNFKNLLKATRSAKKQGIDVKVDQSFGTLSEGSREFNSISSQIENYYNKVVQQIVDKVEPRYLSEMNLTTDVSLEKLLEEVETQAAKEEPSYEAAKQMEEEYRQVAYVKESVFENLLNYNQPITLDNVLASHGMMTDRGGYLRKVMEYDKKQGEVSGGTSSKELSQGIKALTEGFDDYETVQRSYEEFTSALEESVTEAVETLDLSSSDARELSFLYKQISLASNLAREEQYQIPVTLEDQITSMNVKIIHNKNNQPKVAITLTLQEGGEVAAHFTIEAGKVNGYLVSSQEDSLNYMKELQEQFQDNLLEDGKEIGTISSFISSTLDTQTFYLEKKDTQEIETKQLYQVAKQFMKATNARKDKETEDEN